MLEARQKGIIEAGAPYLHNTGQWHRERILLEEFLSLRPGRKFPPGWG